MSGEESWDEVDTCCCRVTYPRARHEHRCLACKETIRVGDRYARTFTVVDGDASSYKHCLRCDAILLALDKAGAEAVDVRLSCGHSWEENFGPCPEQIARLAFVTRDEAQALLKGAGQ